MGQFCGMLMLLTPSFRIWQKRVVKVKTLQDNHHFFCNAPFLTSESICQNVRFITSYLFCWCKFFLLACIRNVVCLDSGKARPHVLRWCKSYKDSTLTCVSWWFKRKERDRLIHTAVMRSFPDHKKKIEIGDTMWWRTKCGDSYSECWME